MAGRLNEKLAARIGARLKELRTMRGFTIENAAARAHVGIGQLSESENGQRMPRVEALLKLARTYGVTLGEMLTGIDDDEGKRRNNASRPPPLP